MSHIKVSNSMLCAVARCETLADLRTRGFSAESLNPRLDAGSAVHLGLSAWLGGKSDAECLHAFSAAYKDFSDRNLAMDDRLYHDNVLRCLQVFLWQHPRDEVQFKTLKNEQQLEAELLPGIAMLPGVRLTDKSDGIVEDEDGFIWGLEWKTTSWLKAAVPESGAEPTFFTKYRLDPQIDTHIWVTQQNGIPIKGVKVFALELKKPPELGRVTKAGKPYKCKDHGIPYESCWTLHVRGESFTFQRDEEQLALWLKEAKVNAAKYALLWQRGELLTPSATRQDGRYSGACATCEFNEFCYTGRAWPPTQLFKREIDKEIVRSGLYD